MPKGPTRQWRKRKEPILDDEIRASVALGKDAHEPGNHEYDKRFYAWLVHDGLKTEAEALEIQRALYRSAQHLGHSLHCTIERSASGGYQVKFRAVCKECARAYVQIKYPDPETRPYNPRRKRNETDHV